MKKKAGLSRECSAANGLLQAWGILQGGEAVSKAVMEPVLANYANHRLYKFGTSLFEHLAIAATMRNCWIAMGPASLGSAPFLIQEFLHKTTVPSEQVGVPEIRAEFTRIADRVKKNYGSRIEYNVTLTAEQNVKAARKTEAELFFSFNIAQRKGA